MAVSVPISVLSAMYIAEYLGARAGNLVKSFVDILAGIPSVVYGMCGILVLVPAVRDGVAPLFGVETTGFCVLTAGLVLAVMVCPVIISIAADALRAVPFEVRETSQAVGATRWQTTRLVAFRGAGPGVFAAVLLGFGRAFGETIAVAMVVGNLPRVPATVFDSAATLPSIIASSYGEMMSIPLYDAAMLMMALLLVAVVAGFHVLALVVRRNVSRWQGVTAR
jgi:phosphate transport system permease protein